MKKTLPKVLIIGSIGIDTIETPEEIEKDILGGAATYASLAASYLSHPVLLAVCGTDLTQKELSIFAKHNIDTRHLLQDGKTFRWRARYDDEGAAHTLKTQLDGVTDKFPKVPKNSPKFVLLANHNPQNHLKVLSKLPKDTFTIADTIEFWIDTMHDKVKQVFSKVDAISITDTEAKKMAGTRNTILAGKFMLSLNPNSKFIIIKKGEHGAITFFSAQGGSASGGKNGNIFFSPGYPLEIVKDPTGAGDSLAGGLISYLAYHNKTDEQTVRNGVLFGSMISSFVAESIGTKYREAVGYNNILERVERVKKMIRA